MDLREDAIWLGLSALFFSGAAGLAVGTDVRNMPGGEVALRIVSTAVLAFGGVLVLTLIFAARWWERF